MTVTSESSASFRNWQSTYAEHGIATFPVGDDKVPAIRGYQKVGRRGSEELAGKFPDAPALGFMCGQRSGITVLDCDSKDERVLADALDRHGKTPVVVRSGSGNFQIWYRHNGERRQIRPWVGRPIDVLGGGFVVAPPSRVKKGRYGFIQGSLDDLDRLPIMRVLPSLPLEPVLEPVEPEGLVGKRDGDGRNAVLFRLVGRAAHHADDLDQLLDYARNRNEFCAEPMADAEVTKIVGNVWKMQCERRNRFGTFGAWFPMQEVDDLVTDRDAFALLGFLRAHNLPDATFMVANGLTKRLKMSLPRLQTARRRLSGRHIQLVRAARGENHPALYRFIQSSYLLGPLREARKAERKG
jgi:hypothetical protein